MKRLLIINAACNITSTGTIAAGIGRYAVGRGWETLLAHGPRYYRPTTIPTYKIQTRLGDAQHFLYHSYLRNRHGLGSTKSTLRLLKIIDDFAPDAVNLHNLHGYYVNYKILLQHLAQMHIPVVWTLHDCWPLTGHCSHFDAINCDKWLTGCKTCKFKKQYPKAIWGDTSHSTYILKEQLIKALPNITFVAPSKWIAKILHQSPMTQNANIQIIHNGVDLDCFNPDKKTEIKNKKRVVGVAASFNQYKGLHDFCELRRELPADYEIILAGTNRKSVKKLPEGIKCLGFIESHQELAGLYASAAVFANPTYQDNFPTVNLEALACGTPVATYNAGGSPETIDLHTGVVVPKGDIKGLAKAIMSLSQNHDIGVKCRKRAEMLYDQYESFKAYTDLFELLLSL